jgi:hypothetical protein
MVAEGNLYFFERVVKRSSIQNWWGPVKHPKKDSWGLWQMIIFQPRADQLNFFTIRAAELVPMHALAMFRKG